MSKETKTAKQKRLEEILGEQEVKKVITYDDGSMHRVLGERWSKEETKDLYKQHSDHTYLVWVKEWKYTRSDVTGPDVVFRAIIEEIPRSSKKLIVEYCKSLDTMGDPVWNLLGEFRRLPEKAVNPYSKGIVMSPNPFDDPIVAFLPKALPAYKLKSDAKTLYPFNYVDSYEKVEGVEAEMAYSIMPSLLFECLFENRYMFKEKYKDYKFPQMPRLKTKHVNMLCMSGDVRILETRNQPPKEVVVERLDGRAALGEERWLRVFKTRYETKMNGRKGIKRHTDKAVPLRGDKAAVAGVVDMVLEMLAKENESL